MKQFTCYLLFTVLLLSHIACSSDDEKGGSKIKVNELQLNDDKYPMHQLWAQALIDDDVDKTLWTFWLMNDQASQAGNTLQGTDINMIAFSILLEGANDEALPSGNFVFEEMGTFRFSSIALNYTIGTFDGATIYNDISEGVLEIKKAGEEYTITFIGVINGLEISGYYKGTLIQLPTNFTD